MIYALGGGWGHLTRALALALRIRQTQPVRILTSSPYAGQIPLIDSLELHLAPLDPQLLGPWVQDHLQDQDWAGLIVDTFARGILGELAALLPSYRLPPCILIQRLINPAYVTQFDVVTFTAQHYDLVINPGDPHLHRELLNSTVPTAPWLLLDPQDLPHVGASRLLLGVNSNDHVVLIIAGGQHEELAFWGETTRLLHETLGTQVRCLADLQPPGCPPELWVRHWPALECLPAAHVIVGGGGYNTVTESITLGIPLVAVPWPRSYDCQASRLKFWQNSPARITIAHARSQIVTGVSHYLAQNLIPQPVWVVNGVDQAWKMIQTTKPRQGRGFIKPRDQPSFDDRA